MKYRAKKSLGQNFLKSKEAIRAICTAGMVEKGDNILEIGPGKGVLTEELLKRGANVTAIEKDRDLVEILNEKFPLSRQSLDSGVVGHGQGVSMSDMDTPKLETIEGDCLDFDPDNYFKKEFGENNKENKIKSTQNGNKTQAQTQTQNQNQTQDQTQTLAQIQTQTQNQIQNQTQEQEQNKIQTSNYKIIANIPYNITGAILKKFLSEVENKPILMALLVQKEVADRIVARNNKKQTKNKQLKDLSMSDMDRGGKESILSLSVKAYGEPKYIMKVSKKYFSPSPKVDSAIILIDKISNKNFKNKDEEFYFFEIIKRGFAHKRKVLIKNLEDVSRHNNGKGISKNESKENFSKIFEKLKIDKKVRAEDVPFIKWIEITRLFLDKEL